MSNDPLRLGRGKDPATGAEVTASHQYATDAGLTITSKPVLDDYGRPIPPKSNLLTEPAAAKAAAKTEPAAAKAAAKKES